MAYAADTKVPVARSQAELEALLRKHGADQFAFAYDQARAVVQFRLQGRIVRFDLPLPQADDRDVVTTPAGYLRSPSQQRTALEQATRARWRAPLLVIKAKLESVESGITTYADEFMAHTLLPDGSTVADWVEPQIDEAYATGAMPTQLLPAARPQLGAGS